MNAWLVFTTAPSRAIGRKLAKTLLDQRLAACAHIASAGESHYWWKGGLERATETAITFKTTKKALPRLMQTLRRIHPYEVPEILAIRTERGDAAYMRWLHAETANPKT